MKKTALIMMGITIVAKLFGFAGEIVLSYFYGTSSVSDAYLVSLTIPSVVFSLIGVGIGTGYIPVYNKAIKDKGPDFGLKFTNNLINFLMILCTAIALIVFIFTEPLVKIFASGFSGETLELAMIFSRIAILNIWFAGWIYVFNGYLHLNHDFISPAVMVIPMNLTILISIAISANTNVFLLSVGNTLSVVIQALLLIPFVRKKGFRYSFVLDKGDPYIRELSFLATPIILGASVSQINRLIDRSFASQISIGGVSAVNYAFKLDAFIQDIFVITLVTIMYPMISKLAAQGNMEGLKKSMSETLGGVMILVVPASIGALIFARPIITLLFGRGAFDGQAIDMTSTALFYYSIGMIGFGFREVLSRGFYSLYDTKTPMYNALIAILLNLALSYPFLSYGIPGIAMTTSLSIILSTLLLFLNFRRRFGSFGLRGISLTFVKVLAASGIMAWVSRLAYHYFAAFIFSVHLSLVLSILLGAVLYFILILMLRIKEVDVILQSIQRKRDPRS